MNGLVRKRVPADGNYFFQSALPHIHSLITVPELQRSLCDHIVEKAENYVVFFCSTRIVRVFRRGHYLDSFAEPQELTRKYTSRQQISAAKNKDLVSLCRSGIIQSEYHDYYKSLPSSSNIDDKLADTDAEEEQADFDQE